MGKFDLKKIVQAERAAKEEASQKRYRLIQSDSDTLNDLDRYREMQRDTEESPVGDLPPPSAVSKENIVDPSLPLKVFVKQACDLSVCKWEEASCDGKYQSRTWVFTRNCRRHSELRSLSAFEASAKIPWSVTEFDEDDQLLFELEWDDVAVPAGETVLSWALKLAAENPITVSHRRGGKRNYHSFISLLGWLQVIRRDKPIFISTREVGKLLGFSHNTAKNMYRMAIKEGFLKLVERTNFQARRSPRYRFAVERVPILKERMEQYESTKDEVYPPEDAVR